MKLKYYMRGLGIGIILTTLLLTLGNPKEKLSDQEIKSRAEKLGMVMKEENNANLEQVLADIKPTALPDGASVTPSPKGSPAPTAKPTVQPTKEPTAAPTPAPTAVPTKEPVKPTIEPTPVIVQPDSSKTDDGQSNSSDITFTVKSGMSSGQVAKMLVQTGLVDDAEDFNDYIEKAGKASIIRVGTYTLPKDSTYKEIITAITTK